MYIYARSLRYTNRHSQLISITPLHCPDEINNLVTLKCVTGGTTGGTEWEDKTSRACGCQTSTKNKYIQFQESPSA